MAVNRFTDYFLETVKKQLRNRQGTGKDF